MSRTLYEIDADILNCIDAETGEITDFEALDALNMERERKIEGVAMYVKLLSREAAAIREEEKALASRRKAKENKAERYAKWLSNVLAGGKFETSKVALSFLSSTKTEIEDALAVTEWLEKNGYYDAVKYKAPDISKDRVKELLKQGVNIPGAVLVENQNIQIK